MANENLNSFVNKKNKQKILFTAGPASLSVENLKGLAPCFGRGDKEYLKVEKKVLKKLKSISGLKKIVTTQGSGSTALEITALNFLRGKILIIDTGYYSNRLYNLAKYAMRTHKYIKKVEKLNWLKISKYKKKVDWVWACVTETSKGLTIPIRELKLFSKKNNAKLALDATASIGLEKNHGLADVISFSSCKGLMGLTGASFICYNHKPKNKVNSFVLNIQNLAEKKMTGPYHTIQSMHEVLKKFNKMRKAIIINKKRALKKYKSQLIYKSKNQPLLCTYTRKKIRSKNFKVLLYKPRLNLPGSVICHLGEAHLGKRAKGKILDFLETDE
jgi:aspartate aminotransferase-like enzyme